MKVEVAFALPDDQRIVLVDVPEGTTAEQAVELSNIKDHYPEIDVAKNPLGVFGKAVKNTQELKEGDRVEIYRPLIADPKESRKRRAEKAKEK